MWVRDRNVLSRKESLTVVTDGSTWSTFGSSVEVVEWGTTEGIGKVVLQDNWKQCSRRVYVEKERQGKKWGHSGSWEQTWWRRRVRPEVSTEQKNKKKKLEVSNEKRLHKRCNVGLFTKFFICVYINTVVWEEGGVFGVEKFQGVTRILFQFWGLDEMFRDERSE